jgi:tRNA pseudouridine55 synthase
MKGILLVDKPSGMTSHDVVDAVRKATGIRRIGHTGTLDPAATGLLILCVGSATRLSEFLTGLDKVYEGTMRLGIVTDSYDMDGAVMEERPVPELTEATVLEAFEPFRGAIDQIPPMVSAVKINGERLYKKARKGEEVDRPARQVMVHTFEMTQFAPPEISFRLRCSRGTYARSICHDVGQALGCGAALCVLRRTAVGSHVVENAAALESLRTPADVEERLLPLEDALDLPVVTINKIRERIVASGGMIRKEDLTSDCPVDSGWVQMKTRSGDLLALGDVQTSPTGVTIQPKRVLRG